LKLIIKWDKLFRNETKILKREETFLKGYEK